MNFTTAMIQLPLVRETRKEKVKTPEDVIRVCNDLRTLAQESFQVLLLDSKNNLTNRHMITLGIADASLVHPREALRPAINELVVRFLEGNASATDVDDIGGLVVAG